MRALVAIGLVVATGSAYADRETGVMLGGLLDVRNTQDAGPPAMPIVMGGARLTLSWDDPFVARPRELGRNAASARLVPELFAGLMTNDVHAVGELGAGLRGEVQVSTNQALRIRVGFYAFARGLVFGEHRDPAGEFGIGEYFPIGDRLRFGFDGGVAVRHDSMATSNLIEVVAHCYIGWVL
jgi:hypothetical protein